MDKQTKRRKELAKKSATFEQFLNAARKFVRWYGFPGLGTMTDYQRFYQENRGQ